MKKGQFVEENAEEAIFNAPKQVFHVELKVYSLNV